MAGVEEHGIDEQIARLRAMSERARNLGPVLQVAAADTVGIITDAFDSSSSPAGQAWRPLAPATVAQRRQHSSKPLIDTGRLRASVYAQPTADNKGLRFGSTVGYGKYHQGSRPFLPVDGTPGNYTPNRAGPGGSHWLRVKRMVRTYILTGRIE